MSKLSSIVINESDFAFDPYTGEAYTVNEIGVHVLRLLKESKELTDIAKSLADEYEVSFENAFSDLLEFRNQLRIYGLIG